MSEMRTVSRLLLIVLAAGCSRPATVARRSTDAVAPAAPGAPIGAAVVGSDAERMLVRRAAMDVVVENVAAAAARAQSVLVSSGGYVERDQRSERSASFTLRIPEKVLDATLDSLATLGSVASLRISAEDVTEEAIDLEARLQSLIASRDRLRKLHDSANSVTEVITVERELGRVQGEVDSLEGRLKFLRSASSLASVDLSIRQRIVLGPLGVIAKGLGTILSKLFVWR